MVEIYKQARNIEKANCDLTDNELFVSLKNYKQLEHQLQTYKDREDKLRELVKESETTYYTEDEAVGDCIVNGKDILQILNEKGE